MLGVDRTTGKDYHACQPTPIPHQEDYAMAATKKKVNPIAQKWASAIGELRCAETACKRLHQALENATPEELASLTLANYSSSDLRENLIGLTWQAGFALSYLASS